MDQSGGTLPFQPSVSMPMSDRIVPDKIYSRADLHTFDGANPEQPVMLAINGYVFDVSEGRQFYEPGEFEFGISDLNYCITSDTI